jgi:hypothetical protein
VDRVLIGDGQGGIREAYDLNPVSDKSYSGELADLDGDGDLDVVISNDTPDAKRVYLNDGRGRFSAAGTFGLAAWPTRNARIADMNGDRQPDIIVANRGGAAMSNYICLNRGKGRFDGDCISVGAYPATTVTPADFDGDGRMDLAVPHRNGGQSYVYLFGADTTLRSGRAIPFGPADASIRVSEAADFDGDGKRDLVAIDERKGAAIYFGKGDGTFSSGLAITDGSPTPYALTVSDLDRDGRMDVIVGFIEAPSAALFNDGSGRRFTTVRFGDGKGSAYGFAVGDLDRDGISDIGVARSDAPNVVYFGSRSR